MTRRHQRAVCVIVTLAVGGGSLWADDRPNILLVLADDAPARDFGCYGNTVVRTPNIDRLAKEGMLFRNMFTPSTSCVPSRTSLYTGLYPMRHGAHPNWSACKPGVKSLPHYLAKLGYRVILLGKKHILPEASFPFEHYSDGGHTKHGRDAERLLRESHDRPWCIVMAKFSAHVPWPHNKFEYEPAKVDLPPDHVDTPPTREMRAKYYSKITEMDDAFGELLALMKETGADKNTVTIFTADHGTDWPKQKWNLYDAGMQTPFIVRWPGRVRGGTVTTALASYVDVVPTLIEIAGGEVAGTVEESGSEPLDGRSFLPVLTGKRTEHHEAVFGCFTWGVMTAYPMRAVRTKTHKYIRNIDSRYRYNWPPDTGWWGESPAPMALSQWSQPYWPIWKSWLDRAAKDPKAATIVKQLQFRPDEELYDIKGDPYETTNIVGDASNLDTLRSLRRRLNEWMEQQGDAGDSAYHKETGRRSRFLDDFYSRQHVVNIRAYSAGETKARIQLVCPLWQADIFYTLDGSVPTRESPRYSQPFVVTPPIRVKTRAFLKDLTTPVKDVTIPETDFRFHYQYHVKPWSW